MLCFRFYQNSDSALKTSTSIMGHVLFLWSRFKNNGIQTSISDEGACFFAQHRDLLQVRNVPSRAPSMYAAMYDSHQLFDIKYSSYTTYMYLTQVSEELRGLGPCRGGRQALKENSRCWFLNPWMGFAYMLYMYVQYNTRLASI